MRLFGDWSGLVAGLKDAPDATDLMQVGHTEPWRAVYIVLECSGVLQGSVEPQTGQARSLY